MQREKEQFSTRSRDLVAGRAADAQELTQERATKRRKLERVKSWKWLCDVDNALRQVGMSMAAFAQPAAIKDRAADPLSWPHLTVASDQGSDGVCAAAVGTSKPWSNSRCRQAIRSRPCDIAL